MIYSSFHTALVSWVKGLGKTPMKENPEEQFWEEVTGCGKQTMPRNISEMLSCD